MTQPPSIHVLDMHTGGEPVRIIRSGYPPVPGESILAKRRYVREHLDHLRKLLMFEPRGHYDMYGALLVEPSLPGADLAVLFMHNEGYSTMCGHATIALGRYAVDQGLVPRQEPFTEVGLECPCGLVKVRVEVKDGKSGRVSFESVPAFLLAEQVRVEVPGRGAVVADISYGGAFYALADAAQFGLDVRRSRVRDLVDAATALTAAVNRTMPIEHPEERDLGFLYGSILTDGRERPGEGPSANVCVFADAEVDRSPTGSGGDGPHGRPVPAGARRPGRVLPDRQRDRRPLLGRGGADDLLRSEAGRGGPGGRAGALHRGGQLLARGGGTRSGKAFC